jgi:Type II secretion system (T2SS), protein G
MLSIGSGATAFKPRAGRKRPIKSERGNLRGVLVRRALVALSFALVCLFPATREALAKNELSAKEARNLIRRVAGIELPSGAVRIRAINASSASEAVALAQIETAFRFESDDEGRWRIAEIRTGDRSWEELDLILRAARGEATAATPSPETGALATWRAAGNLDARLAREMLAHLAGIELPSDAVRVKEVSALYKSAVVRAVVFSEFRFVRGSDNKWRVAEIRTGEGAWMDLERTIRAVNEEKARRARAELDMMATALDTFRRERGFYVVADNQGTLVDQLNPRYLPRVMRLDPWHRPYLYEGERDRYLLRSAGADGQAGTADDIDVSGPRVSL